MSETIRGRSGWRLRKAGLQAHRTCPLSALQQSLVPGEITGSRFVIDHTGPCKVGAMLVVSAALRKRNKNRFEFEVTIQNGSRTVVDVERDRVAVSFEKIMSTIGSL